MKYIQYVSFCTFIRQRSEVRKVVLRHRESQGWPRCGCYSVVSWNIYLIGVASVAPPDACGGTEEVLRPLVGSGSPQLVAGRLQTVITFFHQHVSTGHRHHRCSSWWLPCSVLAPSQTCLRFTDGLTQQFAWTNSAQLCTSASGKRITMTISGTFGMFLNFQGSSFLCPLSWNINRSCARVRPADWFLYIKKRKYHDGNY